jgi:hypothetical protein
MTEIHAHAALAVAYELEPGKWGFQLDDGQGIQLGYWEFAAEGSFVDDVAPVVVRDYLTPHHLVVDGDEAWEDHDGRWSAIVDSTQR